MDKIGGREGEKGEAPEVERDQKEKEVPQPESAREKASEEGAGEKPTTEAKKRKGIVAKLTEEKEELYDRLLRMQADFENYKKRVDKERQELYHHALSEVIQEILPTLDDLERALQKNDSKDFKSYRRGIELIYHNLRETLQKFGLQPIKAEGEIFDPHYHEALFLEETDQYPEHQILEEYKKGYMLKERLLRPAVVKVAVRQKESPAEEPEEGADEPPEGVQ